MHDIIKSFTSQPILNPPVLTVIYPWESKLGKVNVTEKNNGWVRVGQVHVEKPGGTFPNRTPVCGG